MAKRSRLGGPRVLLISAVEVSTPAHYAPTALLSAGVAISADKRGRLRAKSSQPLAAALRTPAPRAPMAPQYAGEVLIGKR